MARNFAPIRREVREEFRDKDGYYVGHFTYGLVFGYNVKNVAANRIPSSYEDLLSPYWKSQMGLDRESYAGWVESGISWVNRKACITPANFQNRTLK